MLSSPDGRPQGSPLHSSPLSPLLFAKGPVPAVYSRGEGGKGWMGGPLWSPVWGPLTQLDPWRTLHDLDRKGHHLTCTAPAHYRPTGVPNTSSTCSSSFTVLAKP